MAEKIVIPIEVQGSGAVKDINKVNDALDNTGKAAEGSKKGFGSLAGLLKGGLGIGAVMSALDALGGALMENQKVQDLMNKAMVVFQGVVNGVIQVLEPLFGWLEKVFKDPVKSIKEFGDLIKQNLINRFNGLLELIPQLGKAIGLLFKGEFAEAGKVAANAVGKVALGIEDTVGLVEKGMKVVNDAVKTISNSTKKAFDNKEALANAENNLARLSILYQGIVEQYDLMSEKQRQIRDDETKTIEERIKANEELAKVLDEGAEKEKANIQARIGIIQMQNNLLGKTKERTNEILSLQQELTGIDAKYAGLKSEQLTNINALEKEKIELKRAEMEGTLEANKIIADSEAELAAEGMDQFEKKMAAIQQEYDARRKLLDDEISQLKEGTQAYVDAQNEKKVLDAQYTADSKALAKERADYETEQAKLVAENQMSSVMGALSGIQSLVGENSRFGKALAVAQAVIDTYSGATKAFAQGGMFGYSGAAGVIASGLANVRAIMQQEVPGVEGGSGSGGGVSMTAPSGPNVSIISGQMNSSAQLLGSLNNSLSSPQRAYVVGQDVNSQQSLDRHIRQNATL